MFDDTCNLLDLFERYPEAIAVFARRGLRCAHCDAAAVETIAEGARWHGFDAADLLGELNALDLPARPPRQP